MYRVALGNDGDLRDSLLFAVDMNGRQVQGSDTPGEGRIERGWRVTKAAWALIRRDPTKVVRL
jgi:hypothetical protein